MKKSFEHGCRNRIANANKILSETSINLDKIDAIQAQGKLLPELILDKEELLNVQDIMGDIIVAETEFAIHKKNRALAWRNHILSWVLFCLMIAGAWGTYRQNEMGNTGKAKVLMAMSLVAIGLVTYHAERGCFYLSKYAAACQDYLKQYKKINKRLDEINLKSIEKVK